MTAHVPRVIKEADEEYSGQDKEIVKWFAWEMAANWSLNSPLCPPHFKQNKVKFRI